MPIASQSHQNFATARAASRTSGVSRAGGAGAAAIGSSFGSATVFGARQEIPAAGARAQAAGGTSGGGGGGGEATGVLGTASGASSSLRPSTRPSALSSAPSILSWYFPPVFL